MMAGKCFCSTLLCFTAVLLLGVGILPAEEWMRFRGENGGGISRDASVPTAWSDEKNLAWKADLPGPGSSSPIIVGDLAIVTCYSGYGVDPEQPGQVRDLKRHVLAFDVHTGQERWRQTVDGSPNEDAYRGFIAEHGYASSTPVSDGKHIFVFFGKSGVFAYDLAGKPLWKRDVGQESGERRWGSGASPMLFGNLVIINASEESSALVALHQETGEVVWSAQADGIHSTWGTPIVAGTGDQTSLILGVPNEIWAFNPETGKLRWYAEGVEDNSYCSSLVTDGEIVYGIEGRSSQAFAIKCGGHKDVTKTNTVWKTRGQNRISTPILYEDRLYTVSRGIAQCLDAKSGQIIYQKRLNAAAAVDERPQPEPGPRPGRRGGRGGGPGGQDYSSPIVIHGNLYYVSRSGLTHVWKTGSEFEVIAQNRFASDEGRYNGTPAVANGRLLIRSDRCLYCVTNP